MSALLALISLRSLVAIRPLCALRSLRALIPLVSLRSLIALVALIPLRPGWSLVALVSLISLGSLIALRALLALRTAVVFDPLAVDVELAIAADGQSVAGQLIVGHFQRRAVPPQTAPDGSLAPIDIQSAAAPRRQAIAREFGATDIVEERGDEGVARIKAMFDGIGADCVLECVGTKESMDQAIRSTRPGGMVGYVGAPNGGPELPIRPLFGRNVGVNGVVAPVRN